MPTPQGVQIAISSSVRNGLVGFGSAIYETTMEAPRALVPVSRTLGSVAEQGVYTAELAALAVTVTCLPVNHQHKSITILTNNQAVLHALANPQQQAGPESLRRIYRAIQRLRERGNTVQGQWMPSRRKLELTECAKSAAKMSTELRRRPQEKSKQARSTALHSMKQGIIHARVPLPPGVGKHAQEVDAALPGHHTKSLYDAPDKKEASTLAQLRTATARLNGYLHRIGVSDTEQCECGTGKETIKHFLFLCPRWNHPRTQLLQQMGARIGDLSFCLGGRSKNQALDPSPWKPAMKGVRAAVHYAIATKRLLNEQRPTY